MNGGKNIIFLTGAAVFVVALCVAGFLLVRGLTQLGGTESDLKSALANLEAFYRREPFPSPGNVAKEKENVAQLARLLNGVLEIAAVGQVELAEGETPARFIGRLGEERNRLVATARASGVTLPQDSSFGFDRYFTGGRLPAPDDVARLSQQLTIVTNLCTILFEEKVLGLLDIERDEFEVASRGSVARRAGGRLCARDGAALAQMGLMGKEALFAKLHFVIEFRTTEKALLAVMSRLAKVAVVTGLTLTKEGSDLLAPRVPGEESLYDEEEAGPVAERPTVTVTNLATVPREQRIVSGIGVERPAKAILELDVYRFRGLE